MIEIDARGMRCPWPALRLAKAMRETDRVRLLADDPAASRELAALAAERGWRLSACENQFDVERNGTGGNLPFTASA